MTYLFVIILLLVLSSKYDFNDNINPQKKEKAFWFVCAIFILIAGLRYNIGADTVDGYAPEYNSFPKFNSSSWLSEISGYARYQPGWFIFESICRLLSPNFVLLQLAHATFINIVYFYFIKKYSKLWFATILIYAVSGYMQLNTEVLRESMAVAFTLLAFDSMVEKKYIRMVVFAILSYLFHVSGIMAIIVVFMSLLNDSKRTRIIFLCVSVLVVVGYASIDFNTTLLDRIFYEGRVGDYISQKVKYSAGIHGWILYYILWVIIPFIILCFIPVDNTKGRRSIVFMFLLFAALKFLTIYSFFFNRFANYLFPFYWIAVSSFYGNFTTKNLIKNRTIILLLLISVIFYSYNSSLFFKESVSPSFNMAYERYYPYKSVLEEGNSYYK